MLTGESEPITCTTKHSDKNYLETTNLIFLGSNVVEGRARGVVVATGNRTTMGKITNLASAEQVFRVVGRDCDRSF
jgi:sodium/potassium-transporting ATPase subunit alpha